MKHSNFIIFITALQLILFSCKKEIELKKPELVILSESTVTSFRGDTIIISLHINAEAGIQSLLLNDQEVPGLNKNINEQTYDHKYIIEEDHINGAISLVFLLKDKNENKVSTAVVVNVVNKDAPIISLADTLNPFYYKFDTLSINLRINCPEGLDKISITNENGIEVYSYLSTDNSKLTNINFDKEIPFNVVPGTSGMNFDCIAVDLVGQTSSTFTIPVKIVERDIEINFFKSNETEDDIGLQMILEDNLKNLDIYGYGTFSDIEGELIPNTLTSIFICNQDSDDGVVVLYEDYGKPKYFYKYNRQTKLKENVLSELVFMEGDSIYIACYDYDWESQVGTFNSAYIFEYGSDEFQLIQTSFSSSGAKGLGNIDSYKNLTDRTKFDLSGPCGIFDEHCPDNLNNWANAAGTLVEVGASIYAGAAIVTIWSGGLSGAVTGPAAGVGVAMIGIGRLIQFATDELLGNKKSSVEPDFCNKLRAPDKAPAESSISNDNTGFTQTDVDENKLQRDPCTNVSIDISASMDIEGSIMVIATGGTTPYLYSVAGSGWEQSQVFPNRYSDGSYLIGAIDENGCSNYVTIPLDRTDPCEGSDLKVIAEQVNTSVIVTASGGIQPYEYSIDNINYSSNNIFNNLTFSEYVLSVKDDQNCTASVNIVLEDYCSNLTAEVQKYGDRIIITASGGEEPYMYSIDGISYRSENEFRDLDEGTYTVFVRDNLDCIANLEISLYNLFIKVTFDGKYFEFYNENFDMTTVFNNQTCILFMRNSWLSGGGPVSKGDIHGIIFTLVNPHAESLQDLVGTYATRYDESYTSREDWNEAPDLHFQQTYVFLYREDEEECLSITADDCETVELEYNGILTINSIDNEIITGEFSIEGVVDNENVDNFAWHSRPITATFRVINDLEIKK